MNPALVSGITGAAPIWNKLMRYLLQDQPDIWPKQPDGVVGAQICNNSGLLPPPADAPGGGGCASRFEYFIKGTVPTQTENLRQAVFIDKATGDLAAPNQVENVEPQEKLILKDGVSSWCLDCTHDGTKPVVVK